MDDYSNDASTNSLLDLSFADEFGIIDYAGDQDWLRMELAGGTSYEIHVHGQDAGYQLAQPRIQIFDGANNLIANSDSAGGGVVLTFTARPTALIIWRSICLIQRRSATTTSTASATTIPAQRGFRSTAKAWAHWNILRTKIFKFKLIAGLSYAFDLRGQATGAGTLQDPLLCCEQ